MTELLQQFHFIRPWWLLALLPVFVCVVLLWLGQKQNQQLGRVFNPVFLSVLVDQTQINQRKWPMLGLLSAWIVTVFALAGPAWQKVPQPVERNLDALVICWDMSPSMLAEDLKPSRLQRSRLKLIDLLQNRSDGQAALIAYAGEAHTVTPLTDDFQTIINLLPALGPTTLPTVGSNPEMALAKAIELLKDAKVTSGHIVFITDEIAPSAFDAMRTDLHETAHQMSIWGVGTAAGAPIPLPNGGFAKAVNGDIVIAKLNDEELRRFASRQRGYYVPMVTNEDDVKILAELIDPQAKQTELSEQTFDQWFEHGQYWALLLLPFVAWTFRKGWIFSLLLFVGSAALLPRDAQAIEWDRLWLNQDQRAQKQLQQGNVDAARQFTAHDRRGAALYRHQSFADAAQEFAQGKTAVDAYNRGNALAHAGQFKDAIKAFDQALQLQPDFQQAQDNRALAQQLADLQQQQEQQQGDGQQQDGEQQDGQQQDGEQQNGQQQQNSGQQQAGQNGEEPSSDANNQEAPKSEQQSQEQQPGQQAQNEPLNAEQTGEKPDPEQNPYSAVEPKDEQPGTAEEQTAARAQPADAEAQPQIPEGAALAQGQTEEQQMLENWLRKVPDDPSGLLRNKFQYQTMQRQRQLDRPSGYSDNQAEQRW